MTVCFPSLHAMKTAGKSLLLLLLAGGCSWFGAKPPVAEPEPSPVTVFMTAANVGEQATLDDADFGRGIQVRMDESFTSAKGESCKRGTVRTDTGEIEVVVICKGSDGRWNMAPRVWGQGIAR